MRALRWKSLVLIGLVYAFGCLVLLDSGWVHRSLTSEEAAAATMFGPAEAAHREAAATRWFSNLFVTPGIVAGSFHLFIPATAAGDRDDLSPVVHPVFTWADQRLRVFWTVWFLALLRLSLAASWYPYAYLILVPAFIDGISRWRIKRTNFDYMSPDRLGLAVLTLELVLLGGFLGLFAPWPMPPWTPAIESLAFAAAFALFLANLPKRI